MASPELKISKPSLINILEGRFGGGRLSQWPIWSPSSPNANVLIETDFPAPQICKGNAIDGGCLSQPFDLRLGFKRIPGLTKEYTSFTDLSWFTVIRVDDHMAKYLRWELQNLLTHMYSPQSFVYERPWWLHFKAREWQHINGSSSPSICPSVWVCSTKKTHTTPAR